MTTEGMTAVMHVYYGKYLEKVENEIDRLVIAEVEGEHLNHENEKDIKLLLANHEGVECLLRKETGKKADL